VWLLPAVLGGLVIRKPGAALYCELLAAFLSALMGSEWWTSTLQGLLQGVAAELVFAVFVYRRYTLPVAVLAGAAAGVAAALFDVIVWYDDFAWATFGLPFIALTVLSAAVVAGAGGWALTRALAQSGALDRFPSGRERAAV
jgi:energy-coupling factor transport system permease protein